MDEARARAVLARAPGLTADVTAALLASAGGDLALASTARTATGVPLPPAARHYLSAPDERTLGADLEWLETSGTVIVLCTDAGYPPLLKQIAGAPAALYL